MDENIKVRIDNLGTDLRNLHEIQFLTAVDDRIC